jgi:tripartite-type tricarboxylate transporter receptor subunit TctC
LRGIAVTTKRRSPVLPDLPTIDSSYPGFDIDNWWALFAPAGTPQIIVNRIHSEVAKALEHPDLKAYMSREGAEPVGSTPGQFAAFFKAEADKFARIVKTSGAKPDS